MFKSHKSRVVSRKSVKNKGLKRAFCSLPPTIVGGGTLHSALSLSAIALVRLGERVSLAGRQGGMSCEGKICQLLKS